MLHPDFYNTTVKSVTMPRQVELKTVTIKEKPGVFTVYADGRSTTVNSMRDAVNLAYAMRSLASTVYIKNESGVVVIKGKVAY